MAETGHDEYLECEPTISSGMSPDMWAADVRGFTHVWNFVLFNNRRNMFAYTAIMTPGTVAGIGSLHRRFGKQPRALMAPVIEWSENGIAWPENVAAYTRRACFNGLPHPKQKHCATLGERASSMRDGNEMHDLGEHYRNVDRLHSLRLFADNGPDEFYIGGQADTLIENFARKYSVVTREDQAGYHPWIDPPIEGGYEVYRIATSAQPRGDLLLIQMLKVLEHFDFASIEYGGRALLPDRCSDVGGCDGRAVT